MLLSTDSEHYGIQCPPLRFLLSHFCLFLTKAGKACQIPCNMRHITSCHFGLWQAKTLQHDAFLLWTSRVGQAQTGEKRLDVVSCLRAWWGQCSARGWQISHYMCFGILLPLRSVWMTHEVCCLLPFPVNFLRFSLQPIIFIYIFAQFKAYLDR